MQLNAYLVLLSGFQQLVMTSAQNKVIKPSVFNGDNEAVQLAPDEFFELIRNEGARLPTTVGEAQTECMMPGSDQVFVAEAHKAVIGIPSNRGIRITQQVYEWIDYLDLRDSDFGQWLQEVLPEQPTETLLLSVHGRLPGDKKLTHAVRQQTIIDINLNEAFQTAQAQQAYLDHATPFAELSNVADATCENPSSALITQDHALAAQRADQNNKVGASLVERSCSKHQIKQVNYGQEQKHDGNSFVIQFNSEMSMDGMHKNLQCRTRLTFNPEDQSHRHDGIQIAHQTEQTIGFTIVFTTLLAMIGTLMTTLVLSEYGCCLCLAAPCKRLADHLLENTKQRVLTLIS